MGIQCMVWDSATIKTPCYTPPCFLPKWTCFMNISIFFFFQVSTLPKTVLIRWVFQYGHAAHALVRYFTEVKLLIMLDSHPLTPEFDWAIFHCFKRIVWNYVWMVCTFGHSMFSVNFKNEEWIWSCACSSTIAFIGKNKLGSHYSIIRTPGLFTGGIWYIFILAIVVGLWETGRWLVMNCVRVRRAARLKCIITCGVSHIFTIG